MTRKATSNQSAQTWSSKSLASHWQHEFFYLLIQFCGRWPAYIFSYIVVLCYVLFVPEVHRRSSYYIGKRFPKANKLARWYHVWRLCQNMAIALIDKAAIGIRGTEEFTYSLKGLEELKELQAQGNGLILLTAHAGSWQASLGGLDLLETPVHVMMYRGEGDVDIPYFEFTARHNINVIPAEDTMGSVIAVAAALRKNELVAIMGDRIFPPTAYTASVDFLGDSALFPTAAYKIAQSTQAPVALLLTRKIGASQMELSVAHILTVPKSAKNNFTPYAQEVAHALEDYVQTTPYQFYNFFDLWSTTNE
ncbi:lysophospholipid acyltransferase family protein [Halodesulfovibrio spirochaetisodalis]|uniref:Lipid A biosynthesis acyltransferase n=1 Tax=Halodesulfovibrio spirochaetisodalis TaxID=1560234 RepID=A0A1B7XBI0_9BACT|nr:lysophospholipid acyltransferase family protein [Halodesulfovibrio spirochaetisodalis]OBQ50108.1 hypothetical protein SP90_10720 [Halodesulfovibrio spirochaetisodalis]